VRSRGIAHFTTSGAGQTLYFPTIQECTKGVNRWINIPSASQTWHALPHPASFVKLVPKAP